MRCRDLMKTDLVTVCCGDTIQCAAELIREENVGFLPVLDESGRVCGAVTDRDLAIRGRSAR